MGREGNSPPSLSDVDYSEWEHYTPFLSGEESSPPTPSTSPRPAMKIH